MISKNKVAFHVGRLMGAEKTARYFWQSEIVRFRPRNIEYTDRYIISKKKKKILRKHLNAVFRLVYYFRRTFIGICYRSASCARTQHRAVVTSAFRSMFYNGTNCVSLK